VLPRRVHHPIHLQFRFPVRVDLGCSSASRPPPAGGGLCQYPNTFTNRAGFCDASVFPTHAVLTRVLTQFHKGLAVLTVLALRRRRGSPCHPCQGSPRRAGLPQLKDPNHSSPPKIQTKGPHDERCQRKIPPKDPNQRSRARILPNCPLKSSQQHLQQIAKQRFETKVPTNSSKQSPKQKLPTRSSEEKHPTRDPKQRSQPQVHTKDPKQHTVTKCRNELSQRTIPTDVSNKRSKHKFPKHGFQTEVPNTRFQQGEQK